MCNLREGLMGIFEKIGLENSGQATIDWDITPSNTFTIFESWGTKERIVRSRSERYYYFFIDNWKSPAKVCLMERGIKHARVLAEIDAPAALIEECIVRQGKNACFEKSYAVDGGLKRWLIAHVLDGNDDSGIRIQLKSAGDDLSDSGLPQSDGSFLRGEKRVHLPKVFRDIQEEEIASLAHRYGFYDSKHNPQGKFVNRLVDNGDRLTVTDMTTGVMWQRQGCDITSIRSVKSYIADLNEKSFAGYADWRLPTMEEAWSLFEADQNDNGNHLHNCFSKEQPFIFVAGQRRPGGYWFADFKQGTVFWASGTNPGGFGRACRSIDM